MLTRIAALVLLLTGIATVASAQVTFPPQAITIGSTSTAVKILANGCWTTTSAPSNTTGTWTRVSCNTAGAFRVVDETALPAVTEAATFANAQQSAPVWAATRAMIADATFITDVACTNSKIYDASTSGNTELVAISGSKHIYVCGYEVLAAGTVNVSLVTGTGTACASAASGTPSTGTSGASAALTPAWQFTTQTGKLSAYPTHGWLLDTGASNALCIKTSAGQPVQAQVWYSQR